MKKIILALAVVSLLAATSVISTASGIFDRDLQAFSFNEARFDRRINFLLKIAHIPSIAACTVKDDEVIFAKAYGFYDIENRKKAEVDTIYPVGSISKPVTATALMQLYDQGYFNLDDNVSEWMPFDLKNPNFPEINITFRMLLSHHASIVDGYNHCYQLPGDPHISSYPYSYIADVFLTSGSLYTPKIWMDNKKPGEEYSYSNVGYGLLEYLIERISGKKFNEYCKQNIFEPLSMHNSSYRLEDFDISQVAVPYEYIRYPWGKHIRLSHYAWIPYGCGNLRTTLEDLSHFLIAHMNGGIYKNTRILNEPTVELMHTVQFTEKSEYGLGFFVDNFLFPSFKTHIGHTGSPHNFMYYRPSEDVGVIIFMNSVAREFSPGWLITNYIYYGIIDLIAFELFQRARKTEGNKVSVNNI